MAVNLKKDKHDSQDAETMDLCTHRYGYCRLGWFDFILSIFRLFAVPLGAKWGRDGVEGVILKVEGAKADLAIAAFDLMSCFTTTDSLSNILSSSAGVSVWQDDDPVHRPAQLKTGERCGSQPGSAGSSGPLGAALTEANVAMEDAAEAPGGDPTTTPTKK